MVADRWIIDAPWIRDGWHLLVDSYGVVRAAGPLEHCQRYAPQAPIVGPSFPWLRIRCVHGSTFLRCRQDHRTDGI